MRERRQVLVEKKYLPYFLKKLLTNRFYRDIIKNVKTLSRVEVGKYSRVKLRKYLRFKL